MFAGAEDLKQMQNSHHAVQLFITCLIDSMFPEVGLATVEVLARAGVEISFNVNQTCCGQPAFNAGYWDQAREMARNTIRVLEATKEIVVVPSGSCAAMIRKSYLELFSDRVGWRARAEELAGRVFLVDRLRVTELGSAYKKQLAYHPSCHLLRELDIDRQPKSLLSVIGEAKVHHLKPECCGFGGLFAVEFPEISREILTRKMASVEEAGAEVVVGCDVSCLMQIEGGFRRQGASIRCAHLVQVLTGKEPGLR